MAVSVSCPECGHALKIPDGVYERRVSGQVAVLKCKRCKGGMRVDGTVSPPRVTKAEAAEPEASKPEASKPEAKAKPAAEPTPAPSPASRKPSTTTEVDSSWSILAPPMPAPAANAGPAPAAKPVASAKPAQAKAPTPKPAQAKAPTPKPAQAKAASPRPPAAAPRAAAKGTARAGKSTSASTRWLVSYDDADDDRKMNEAAIARELGRGALTAETIVWREGMSDWLPIGEVPELAAHLPKTPADKQPSLADKKPLARKPPPPRRAAAPAPAPAPKPFLKGSSGGSAHQAPHATSDEEFEVITSVRPEMLGTVETPAAVPQAPPLPRALPPTTAAAAPRASTSDEEFEVITSVRPEMLGTVETPAAIPPAPPPPRASAPDNEAPPSLPSAAGLAAPTQDAPPPPPLITGNELLSGLTGGQDAAEPIVPTSSPTKPRRGALLWVLAIGGVALVVVLALVVLGRNRSPAPAVSPSAPAAATPPPTATPAESPPPRTATPAENLPPRPTASAAAAPPEPENTDTSKPAAAPEATGSTSSGDDFFKQFAAAAGSGQPAKKPKKHAPGGR